MMVVRSRPTSVATKGLFREPIIFTTSGISLMPAMELDMVLNPRKRTPKPIMISANFFILSILQNIATSTPTNKIMGAYAERLNETNCEVTVVPILAPKITPAAWYRFISPALTKLTTMAVQAEEDWMIPVNMIPTIMPEKRFVVKISRIRLSFAPATFSMESLMTRMPKRNRPSPPAIESIILALICFSPECFPSGTADSARFPTCVIFRYCV